MNCPTCGNWFDEPGRTGDVVVSWCRVCGTFAQTNPDGQQRAFVPKLVERCWAFEAFIAGDVHDGLEWNRLGIREAIHKPEDRPQ